MWQPLPSGLAYLVYSWGEPPLSGQPLFALSFASHPTLQIYRVKSRYVSFWKTIEITIVFRFVLGFRKNVLELTNCSEEMFVNIVEDLFAFVNLPNVRNDYSILESFHTLIYILLKMIFFSSLNLTIVFSFERKTIQSF